MAVETGAYDEEFAQFYDKIIEWIMADLDEMQLPADSIEHIRKMMEYNIRGGKQNRGRAVVDTVFAILRRNGETVLSPEIKELAFAAGWAVEWLQAALLVADDIMDRSLTRRGRPCWYRLGSIGQAAINDALMLETQVSRILRRYFRGSRGYMDALELVHDAMYRTECGQLVDLLAEHAQRGTFELFTGARHALLARLKTSHYSFYLPVALALVITDTYGPQSAAEAAGILLPLGEYFQTQDDYLDAFGDAAVLGKIGSDVEENKCSWLLCAALQRCTAEQRRVLELNYGRGAEVASATTTAYGAPNQTAAECVKSMYRDLKLPEAYDEYEADAVARLRVLIDGLGEQSSVPREVYGRLLDEIHRRKR